MAIGRVPGATGIQPSIVDAKGDLIAATAADSVSRLAAGSNNQVLMADSAQATGLKYANEATATLTTTGDILYASAANTPARLAIGSTDQVLKVSGGVPVWGAAAAAGFKGCYARITAAQTLSNATETALNFGGERFDTNGFHDNSVNNTRITIPAGLGGYYLIMGMQSLEDMATNNNYRLNIRVNAGMGTAYSGSYSGGDKLTLGFTNPILNLSAGDYIEMYAYQNSGGSVNTVYDPNYDFGTFIVQYLGA